MIHENYLAFLANNLSSKSFCKFATSSLDAFYDDTFSIHYFPSNSVNLGGKIYYKISSVNGLLSKVIFYFFFAYF